MSTIRLSVVKNRPYATEPSGDIVLEKFSRRSWKGKMDELAEGVLAEDGSQLSDYLDKKLETAASELPADAPVVIMVNGFLFDPEMRISPDPEDTDNPHGRIFHYQDRDEFEEQRHHTTGWPLHLGFDPEDETGKSGIAVAFGWKSQPGFASSLINHFKNFYARAYENGGDAAWILANVIRLLSRKLDGHDIHLMCHSLGSRVVVRALAQMLNPDRPAELREDLAAAVGRIGRVIILGGAEYTVEAQLMMRRMYAAKLSRDPQIYNIVSRENDVLDKLGENFGPRTFGNSQVIGHNGLDTSGGADNWIDIQIDRADMQAWMEARGIDISGDRPNNVWDHWYYFTYRGNMALYRAILRQADSWDIQSMRLDPADPIPDGVPKRWWD